MKIRSKRIIQFFVALTVLFVVSACSNSLLSLPPTTVSVTLVGTPVVTPSYDSCTISFSTSSNVTVLIEYGTEQNNLVFATPRTNTAATEHMVVVQGLQPTTPYYYKIRAFLSSSRSFSYDTASFTTTLNPGSPGFASGPTATPTYSSIQIDWTSPVAVTYLVEWGLSSGTYPYTTPLVTPAATSCSVTISGLTQGQTIYYRVRMFWSGADYVSGEFSATTNAQNPPDYVRARGIWLIGGLSGSAISTTVAEIDLYDPVTNIWYPDVAAGASGTTYVPVSFAGYAAYNGKLYVIGGFDSTGACRNDVQIYDPSTNSWSAGTPITAARANITAAVYNGRIYIIGGTQDAAAGTWGAFTTNYEYNIAGNSWALPLLALPSAVANRFALAYSGVIYHFGGRTAVVPTPTYTTGHEGYTIATNSITSGTEVVLSVARAGMAGMVYAKTGITPSIIIIGGISASSGTTGNFINQGTTSATVLNTVQYLRYPFIAPSTWIAIKTGKEYPTSIAFSSAVIVTIAGNSYVYNFGGTQALGASASGQASVYRVTAPPEPPTAWDPVSWESRANMPRGRWGHGAVTFASQE